jgi:hypothetical protein
VHVAVVLSAVPALNRTIQRAAPAQIGMANPNQLRRHAPKRTALVRTPQQSTANRTDGVEQGHSPSGPTIGSSLVSHVDKQAREGHQDPARHATAAGTDLVHSPGLAIAHASSSGASMAVQTSSCLDREVRVQPRPNARACPARSAPRSNPQPWLPCSPLSTRAGSSRAGRPLHPRTKHISKRDKVAWLHAHLTVLLAGTGHPSHTSSQNHAVRRTPAAAADPAGQRRMKKQEQLGFIGVARPWLRRRAARRPARHGEQGWQRGSATAAAATTAAPTSATAATARAAPAPEEQPNVPNARGAPNAPYIPSIPPTSPVPPPGQRPAAQETREWCQYRFIAKLEKENMCVDRDERVNMRREESTRVLTHHGEGARLVHGPHTPRPHDPG